MKSRTHAGGSEQGQRQQLPRLGLGNSRPGRHASALVLQVKRLRVPDLEVLSSGLTGSQPGELNHETGGNAAPTQSPSRRKHVELSWITKSWSQNLAIPARTQLTNHQTRCVVQRRLKVDRNP